MNKPCYKLGMILFHPSHSSLVSLLLLSSNSFKVPRHLKREKLQEFFSPQHQFVDASRHLPNQDGVLLEGLQDDDDDDVPLVFMLLEIPFFFTRKQVPWKTRRRRGRR